tara:strand:- start:835 stop:1278 length:444 start_codon:yes stop_codon:yes gene_type:complete
MHKVYKVQTGWRILPDYNREDKHGIIVTAESGPEAYRKVRKLHGQAKLTYEDPSGETVEYRVDIIPFDSSARYIGEVDQGTAYVDPNLVELEDVELGGMQPRPHDHDYPDAYIDEAHFGGRELTDAEYDLISGETVYYYIGQQGDAS